jgi:peptide/nickel transport system substrate-binding protein
MRSDPQCVRRRLKQPWPDFMTFYATSATSAAWIVPKKYTERVESTGLARGQPQAIAGPIAH